MKTFVEYNIGVGLDIVNKLSDFFTLYAQFVFCKKEYTSVTIVIHLMIILWKIFEKSLEDETKSMQKKERFQTNCQVSAI